MTPEEHYALKEGWAEGRGRSRHAKVAALVPDWACPPQEEFIQAAKIGLWNACLKHRELEHGGFGAYASWQLRREFQNLKREYTKLSSQKQNHRQIDDPKVVEEKARTGRSLERIRVQVADALLDREDTARG